MTRWIVDGMNVIGSRPTGWWRDRPGAMRELVGALEAFAGDAGDDVAVVFDGSPFDLSSETVDVRFARGRGRNAAVDGDTSDRRTRMAEKAITSAPSTPADTGRSDTGVETSRGKVPPGGPQLAALDAGCLLRGVDHVRGDSRGHP